MNTNVSVSTLLAVMCTALLWHCGDGATNQGEADKGAGHEGKDTGGGEKDAGHEDVGTTDVGRDTGPQDGAAEDGAVEDRGHVDGATDAGEIKCISTADCPVGLVCSGNLCVPCTGDGDCGPKKVCESGLCNLGCRTDPQCDEGQFCDNMKCVSGCRDNMDCAPQICDTTTHQCANCVPGGCPGGHICRGGYCGPCSYDDDCGHGSICCVFDWGTSDLRCVAGDCCTSFACPEGQGCVDNVCGPCQTDADCQENWGYLCEAGQCVTGCRTTEQCGYGSVGCTSGGACMCTPETGCYFGVCHGGTCTECQQDADCPGDPSWRRCCGDGRCYDYASECCDDLDCPLGQRCVQESGEKRRCACDSSAQCPGGEICCGVESTFLPGTPIGEVGRCVQGECCTTRTMPVGCPPGAYCEGNLTCDPGHADCGLCRTSGWQPQDSGTSSDLYRIAKVDASIMVIVGGERGTDGVARPVIVRSADAGNTWTPVPLMMGVEAVLRAVVFSGARGWAVGDRATVLRTEDAGATWDKVFEADDRYILSDVYFADGNHGWAVGRRDPGGGLLLSTVDGGVTWSTLMEGVSTTLNVLAFPNPQTGIAAGGNPGIEAVVIRSSDAGRRWSQDDLGGDMASTLSEIRDMTFADSHTGWLVAESGFDPNTGRPIAQTWDGGLTWHTTATTATKDYWGIFFLTPQHGWLVGRMNYIMVSDDGAANWQPQHLAVPMVGLLLRDVFFVDADNGWTVGTGGTILRTATGGNPL
ncbi:MAG: hypothetical protein HY897_00115 [Deltaproteobacteria bacterium]|nr:hypothetical protein [Deltaproteobacteria bacterium]